MSENLVLTFQTQLSAIMETVLKSAMYEITRLVEDGFLEEVRRGQQEVTRSHQEVESLRTLLQRAESQLKDGSQRARCGDCGKTDVYNEETDDRPPGVQDSVLLLSGCDLKLEEEPEVRWRSCGQETVESSQVAAKPTPPTPPAPSPSLVGSVKEEEEGEEDMEPWRIKVAIQPSAAHTYTEEQQDSHTHSHTLVQSTGDSIGFPSADPEAQQVTQTPRLAGPSQNQSRGTSNDSDRTRSRASPVWIGRRILDTDTDVHRQAQSNLRLVREPLSSSESAEAKQLARDFAPPTNPSTAGASVSSSSSGCHVFSSLNYRIPSKYKPSAQTLPRMRVYRDAAKRSGYPMYNRGTAQGGLTSQTPTQQQGNHQHHHPGRLALRCPVCGKVFPHPSSLKAHQQTHTGERPFICALCGRSFTKLSNLKAHRRVHTGERPYSCSDCGKRFTQKCNLKRHQRIHMENDI